MFYRKVNFTNSVLNSSLHRRIYVFQYRSSANY